VLRSVSVGASLGYVELVGGGTPVPAVYIWPHARDDMGVLLRRVAEMAPGWVSPGIRDGQFVQVQVRPISLEEGTWHILAWKSEQLEITRDLPGGAETIKEVTQHTHDVWVGGIGAGQIRKWAQDIAARGLLILVLDGPATDGQSWAVWGADTWVPPENVNVALERH